MTSTRKKLSQFFTPPEVVRFMYDLIGFQAHWRVLDPACGDGVFLREAIHRGCTRIMGIDIDPAAVHQANRSLPAGSIRCGDGLRYEGDTFDLVIGNPPFRSQYRTPVTESIKRRLCDEIGLPARRSMPLEVLFLAKFIALARPGGHVAIILPMGVFANARLQFVREHLIHHYTVRAIIGLPRSLFPATQAHTGILYLTRTPPPTGHQTFLATVKSDITHEARIILDGWKRGANSDRT